MKKESLLIALAGCLLPAGVLMAQEASDSTRLEMLDEVVVTGTRHATDVRHLSQTVSVVNRKKIEQSIQPSLLPILTENVPSRDD